MTSIAMVWVLVIALGLAVGSFVNVLIHRLPRNESILRPRSRCTTCGQSLRWYHNVPVLSWIVLGGRCAYCHAPISPVYPLVELLTAGLFAVFFARYGVTWTALGFWYLSATLVTLFFIDLRHQIIPNRLTYPGVIVGLLVAAVSPHISVVQSLVGVILGTGAFVGIAALGHVLFGKESLGGGDIKLAAMLGAFLGGWKILLVLVVSAFIGLVISLVAMAFSPALRRDRTIPYGPFLALATVVVVLFGEWMIDYYVTHFLS